MKVSSSPLPTQEMKKKEYPKPRLALDAAFKKQRSGLEIYVEKYGKGEKIEKGKRISVHYEGFLADDYKMFDSSRKKRRPFEFEFGKGQVIAGWEEALSGVRSGSKLQLKIPASLAYGMQGVPSLDIPANSNLIFKVEVLRVK